MLATVVFVAALGACKPSVPARVKEIPIAADSSCRESHLLHIDPDNCQWKRIDAATGKEEILFEDPRYCASYDLSVHPTESRLFAHMMPDDDRKPDIVREVSVAEGVIRSVAIPRDYYVEYSDYGEDGRLTVIVSDELPEPSRAVRFVYDALGREDCVLSRARALAYDGAKWAEVVSDMGECDEAAPTDALAQRLLSPSTMIGTTTLVSLLRVEDKATLDRLNAMDSAAYPPVWRAASTTNGRVLRGADDYGDAFWLAFADADGRVAGNPMYDDNTKLRVRGPYLLTTAGDEENARVYDIRKGTLLWEAESYSATVFWPCPVVVTP